MRKEQQDQIIMMAMIGTFLTTYAAARGVAQVAENIVDKASDTAREVSSAAGNAGKVVIDVAEAASNPGKTIGEAIAGGIRRIF